MKKIAVLLVFLFTLFGCSKTSEYEKKSSWLAPIKDAGGDMVLLLNADIKLITIDGSNSDALLEVLNETVTHYHKLLDVHHYYEEDGSIINNLKVINDSYGCEEAVKTDPDLIGALKESFVLCKLSDGYFNPTIGSLSELWSPLFNKQFNEDPAEEELDKARACTIAPGELEEIIEIDEDNSTVIFHRYEGCDDKVIIDLGAFAKGYALDMAGNELRKFGSPFLIDGGSSSMITYVPEDMDMTWTIGVRSPQSGGILYAFEAKNIAVSTSGDDERFFLIEKDGTMIRRHHILDPYSGYSRNWYRGITLTSEDDAMALDALSTALFNVEDEITQEKMTEHFSEYYDIGIDRCLLKEENGRLSLIIDKDFDEMLLPEYDSSEIYEKTILTD